MCIARTLVPWAVACAATTSPTSKSFDNQYTPTRRSCLAASRAPTPIYGHSREDGEVPYGRRTMSQTRWNRDLYIHTFTTSRYRVCNLRKWDRLFPFSNRLTTEEAQLLFHSHVLLGCLRSACLIYGTISTLTSKQERLQSIASTSLSTHESDFVLGVQPSLAHGVRSGIKSTLLTSHAVEYARHIHLQR